MMNKLKNIKQKVLRFSNEFANSKYGYWLYLFLTSHITLKVFLCVYFLMSLVCNQFLFSFPLNIFTAGILGSMMPLILLKINEVKDLQNECDYWEAQFEKTLQELYDKVSYYEKRNRELEISLFECKTKLSLSSVPKVDAGNVYNEYGFPLTDEIKP